MDDFDVMLRKRATEPRQERISTSAAHLGSCSVDRNDTPNRRVVRETTSERRQGTRTSSRRVPCWASWPSSAVLFDDPRAGYPGAGSETDGLLHRSPIPGPGYSCCMPVRCGYPIPDRWDVVVGSGGDDGVGGGDDGGMWADGPAVTGGAGEDVEHVEGGVGDGGRSEGSPTLGAPAECLE